MQFDANQAKLTVELSRLAYRNPTEAQAGAASNGLTEFTAFDSGVSTQAFLAAGGERRYLAFRGTEANNPRDWVTDSKFGPKSAIFGRVHSGFDDALDEVWPEVSAALAGDTRPLTVTGHSLGGGLAILAASRLAESATPPESVYVYGCPRTGLADFRDAYNVDIGDSLFRIINHIDIVTRVPLLTQGYRAPGERMYFDKSGKFHANAGAWQIIKEDLIYRLTNFKSIKALGLGTHEIGQYSARVGSL